MGTFGLIVGIAGIIISVFEMLILYGRRENEKGIAYFVTIIPFIGAGITAIGGYLFNNSHSQYEEVARSSLNTAQNSIIVGMVIFVLGEIFTAIAFFKINQAEKRAIEAQDKEERIQAEKERLKYILPEKEKAELPNRMKYCSGLLEMKKTLGGLAAIYSSVASAAYADSNHKAVKHDSAIWGGIANGIGGIGAGVSTAIEIEIENAKAEENAKKIRENGEKAYKYHTNLKFKCQRMIERCDDRINQIMSLNYDDRDINKLFNMLKFSSWSYELDDKDGYIKVSGSIDVTATVTLSGKQAVIDGSVKILVHDGSEIIGYGYYCPPGFENKSKITVRDDSGPEIEIGWVPSAGFGDIENGRFSTYCIIDEKYYPRRNNNKELTFTVEPISMWIIDSEIKSYYTKKYS